MGDIRTFDGSRFANVRHPFHPCDCAQCSVTTVEVTLENMENAESTFSSVAGRFELLKSLPLCHVCPLIDCVRGTADTKVRIFFVQQSFAKSLPQCANLERIRKWATQISEALALLQRHSVAYRNLTCANVRLDCHDNAYLFNIPLFYSTAELHELCTVSLCPFRICPPETLLANSPNFVTFKADVWALGLVLYRLYTGEDLFPSENAQDYFASLTDETIQAKLKPFESPDLVDFISLCLTIDHTSRPLPSVLRKHKFLEPPAPQPINSREHAYNLELLFSLWLLDSSDAQPLQQEYFNAHHVVRVPPILTLPKTVSSSKPQRYTVRVIPIFLLDLNRVRKQIVLESVELMLAQMQKQPLTVREKSVAYQFHRVQMLSDLLLQYPLTATQLQAEMRVDIPKFLRRYLWTVSLGVETVQEMEYLKYSALARAEEVECTEEQTVLDRQLSADIHRCHTYHPTVASRIGNVYLRRIICAWLRKHSDNVYWQGFDSVTAVFLSLRFGAPGPAFACLDAFVAKYLTQMLKADNALTMANALRTYDTALRYFDPILANRLALMGITSDLYAIPWVLTLFAHVLAIHQTYLLWDHLLTFDTFPSVLMVAVLLLPTTRKRLMDAKEFDDMLNVLSEIYVDVYALLSRAKQLLEWVPGSTCEYFRGIPSECPTISMQDYFLHLTNIRTIDLRGQSDHLQGSTIISVHDLHVLEHLFVKQRDDKHITVIRTTQPLEVLGKLTGWGVPGVCLLIESDYVSCDCVPKEKAVGKCIVKKCPQ